MRYLFIIVFVFLLNCGEKKSVQLPEITDAKITEVLDVSPAYIFYDETQPDSTEFNRKNLISTTNWLVNVDKRLTLKQMWPHLQYLQNKRHKASMHKNENAKNYFTCNDKSIGNLGFLEFTDVNYKVKNPDFINFVKENSKDFSLIYFSKNKTISVSNLNSDFKTYVAEYDSFSGLKTNIKDMKYKNIILLFEDFISFQEYVTIKSELLKLTSSSISINVNEFIY